MFVTTYFASCNSSENWLIDSGYTNHMTHDESLFKDFDRIKVSSVRISNAEHIVVKGKGMIAIQTCTCTKIIFYVYFVLEINQNLLSVGQLLERGFKVIFGNKQCLIKDANEQEMFKIKMSGKSFSLDPMKNEQAAYFTLANNVEIWHKRLSHFHHSAVLYMQKKELVQGLPHMDIGLSNCIACQYGKQSKLSFKQLTWKALEKL